MKRFLTLLAATAASAAVTAAITLPAGANDVPGKAQNAGGEVNIATLTACLRDHGLNPPADLDQLKPWLVQQDDTAALKACGFDPPSKQDHGAKPDGPCREPAEAAAASAKRRVSAR